VKKAAGASKPAPAKTPPAKTSAAKPAPAKPAAAAKAAPDKKGATVNGKPAPAAKSATPTPPADASGKKPAGPKGITIVSQKPMRKAKPKPKLQMPMSEPLLKPGGKWKPLIPSGPKAPPTPTGFTDLETAEGGKAGAKAKLPKRELDKYRDILKRKRSELVGDIATMEEEALRQNSGSLSSLPQHMAEQGSDASEQSLSLDLAQVDRNLIREIDEALRRIEAGTYGICELTHKPISSERLAELPWARYSIEAARELERRAYRS
jgi:RNA polymerase-binding transcription factor DksA